MPPTCSRRPFHRPAYAFNGWIMLLFLLLVALLVFSSYMSWSNMPANPRAPYGHTNAYSTGFMIGIWVSPVLVPLVFLGISWLVGWGVHHMFGKSDDAGNVGASLVLLFALSLAGVNVYFVLNRPAPGAATASGSSSSPESSRDALRRTDEENQRQAEAAQQALRNANPLSQAPQVPQVPQAPALSQQPIRPAPPPIRQTTNPVAQPVIDDFAKDLTTRIDSLVALVSKTLPDLSRVPAHDLTKIKARAADAESLRTAADALKKPLSTAANDLSDKLQAAGVPSSEAQTTAFQWANVEFRATSRGFGADALIRLCDKAKEECDFLSDNIGKWTLDAKGEVKAADFQIKSKAGSLHFFVKAEADRKDWIIGQMQGK